MKQNNNQQLLNQEKELLSKYELLNIKYFDYLELMINTKFHLQEIKEQKSHLTEQLLMLRKGLLEKEEVN